MLENTPNLDFYQDSVIGSLKQETDDNRSYNFIRASYFAKSVVLTNGTFLNGIIHIGEKTIKRRENG